MRRLHAHHLALAVAALALVAPATVALAPTVTIAAAANQFLPAAVVVPAGSTVLWDGVLLPHTVTTSADALDMVDGFPNDPRNSDDDADSFRKGLPMGTTVTHVFENPGTFYYYCEPHVRLGMWGVVEVV